MPAEPWYYRFLIAYAWLVAGLGLLQFGLFLLFLAMRSINQETYSERGPTLSEAAFYPAIYSIGLLLGSLLMSAPIFLFVDAARNLRAIRYQRRS